MVMARKTHQQRVDEETERYRKQLDAREPSQDDLVHEAKARAKAEEKAAAIAEVRRQRAIGKALDLKAALDAVRGGEFTLEAAAAIAQGDLTKLAMVFWVQNMSVLTDRAAHAPDVRVQVDAADKGAQRSYEMMQLIAEAQGKIGPQAQAQASVADDISREEKIRILRQLGRTG